MMEDLSIYQFNLICRLNCKYPISDDNFADEKEQKRKEKTITFEGIELLVSILGSG